MWHNVKTLPLSEILLFVNFYFFFLLFCTEIHFFRQLLLRKPSLHAIDMAVFLGRVFWADLSSSAIYSAEIKDTNPNVTLVHSSLLYPNAITFNHSLYHNTSLHFVTIRIKPFDCNKIQIL